jgi:hypothetical protein
MMSVHGDSKLINNDLPYGVRHRSSATFRLLYRLASLYHGKSHVSMMDEPTIPIREILIFSALAVGETESASLTYQIVKRH